MPCYRRDYDGEFLITELAWRDGTKQQHREWVPNNIENHHISGRAAVILGDTDRRQFDYARLQRHRGGLLGKKRLQTYGSGPVWQHMVLDFWVSKDAEEVAQAVEGDYHSRSTVYTTPKIVLGNPGRLYLIPQAPLMSAPATSVYLAAFDGHQEVFLLGGNQDTAWPTTSTVNEIATVMAAYDTTQFVLVGVEARMPGAWRQHRNVICQPYREWISYCDV